MTTVTTTITVTKGDPDDHVGRSDSVYVGTALGDAQLNATEDFPGTVIYKPAAGTGLRADSATLKVTFNPTSPFLAVATASVTLVVNALAVPVLTWAAPDAMPDGAALGDTQLNATLTDPVTSESVPGTFAYSPASGTVLAPGVSHTLKVVFRPDDPGLYATAHATASVSVNAKVTPTLTWEAPAAIDPGTALNGQLNATATEIDTSADIPGRFAYAPASGTVLVTHTLTVTFTPTDTAAYATATTMVSLTVNGTSRAATADAHAGRAGARAERDGAERPAERDGHRSDHQRPGARGVHVFTGERHGVEARDARPLLAHGYRRVQGRPDHGVTDGERTVSDALIGIMPPPGVWLMREHATIALGH